VVVLRDREFFFEKLNSTLSLSNIDKGLNMYICMCICMYMICIHVYTYLFLYLCMICKNMYVYRYLHTCICIYVLIYISNIDKGNLVVTTAVGTSLREVLRVEILEKGAGPYVYSAAVGDVLEV
jgi:hypothetical protein